MTTAISFSRQNDTGSRARALCLLEKLVVVLVLVLESKGLYFNNRTTTTTDNKTPFHKREQVASSSMVFALGASTKPLGAKV